MSARLGKELKQLKEQPLTWASVDLDNDNLFKWVCVLNGPENSPFEGGKFTITLELPTDYPFKAPKVFFKTPVYHPNVQQKDGAICNAILVDSWSPQLKIHEVLLIIRQMLAEPNIDSPLEEEVAKQYRENRAAFNKTAKEWVKKHASGK